VMKHKRDWPVIAVRILYNQCSKAVSVPVDTVCRIHKRYCMSPLPHCSYTGLIHDDRTEVRDCSVILYFIAPCVVDEQVRRRMFHQLVHGYIVIAMNLMFFTIKQRVRSVIIQ
jgi:hypothetical protein